MLDPNKAVEQMQSEFSAGFQAGASSRNEELQRLQMALADANALELGTAEKCDQLRAEIAELEGNNYLNSNALRLQKEKNDQLRANIISLIGSLIRAANYIDVLGGTSGEYRKAVMLTPKQSITEYRNKVIEAFVNEFSRHVGGDGEFWLHELKDFAMK